MYILGAEVPADSHVGTGVVDAGAGVSGVGCRVATGLRAVPNV